MGVFALVILILCFIPIRPTYTSPAVIFDQQGTVVRVECPGFIADLLVDKKQSVHKGQILAILHNEDEESNLAGLKTDLRKSEIRAQQYLSEDMTTDYQSERANIESLKTQINELETYTSTLVLKSPMDGIAIPDLKKWKSGEYATSGTPLFEVHPSEQIEATIVIPQTDADDFKQHMNRFAKMKLTGRPTVVYGTISRINPRATYKLPHPALSAENGGPLAVIPSTDPNRPPQLLTPHFVGAMKMDLPKQLSIPQGTTGIVKFTSNQSEFIWQIAYKKLEAYLTKVIQRAKAAANA